jgi:hypothetical protein
MRRGLRTALLLLALAPAAAGQAPSAPWQTIETVHFRVHYPAPYEAWAKRAAASLEDIHARVTAMVGYSPDRRVEVVVADPEADSNGSAVPWLDRPEIALWTSPPESESSTGAFVDWVELLAAHEVAHVAHLARPRAGPFGVLERFSPAPLGPLALGAPRWLYEGYATLIEGALTGSGRPASSFRAMVLRRLAIDGEFPTYAKLGRSSGWLGGSMAYLAGSAYLEWLAARAGEHALPGLWRRMAAGRSFSGAFRDEFGDSPKSLYEKFTLEVVERAVAEERRLRAAGLVEGAPCLRLEGGTAALAVSPDGSKLLARRDPRPRESFLAIWEISEASTEEARPRWTLPRADGFSASDPRFMPDGRSVLFARRAPDGEGVRRFDLYRWELEGGRVDRVTRGADVSDADPAPDGRVAVGVRNRFGASALVRIDLATGASSALPTRLETADAWTVWSHPRFSPDGRTLAVLLHRGGRWRLVTLPAQGGAIRELETRGAPVGPPAWSPDGMRLLIATDASGVWNVAEVPAGGGQTRELTRVTGGAFAPAPGGDRLFFLDFTSKGVNIRRLELPAAPVPPLEFPVDAFPILPPSRLSAPARFEAGFLPEPRPYSAWERQAVRSLVNFSFGPDGNAVQLGVDGGDVVGRLHWFAAASFGNAAGPRGGTLAAAWRGWPVELSAQIFSAVEKPGAQSLSPRSELDQERRGGYAGLAWGRPFTWGRVGFEAGGGAARVEAFSNGERFTRALGSARGFVAWRRTRGRSGFGADLEASGSAGATGGAGWSQGAAGARVLGITPFATLSAGGRWGATGGSPSRFDVFALGGAPSVVLPPGLDRNRIESPALPAAVQLGERFESYRAELAAVAVPLAVYAEWQRAWDGGAKRPDAVRALGAELRLDRLVPQEFGRSLSFRIGLARVASETPRIRATRGYASLIYRP